MIQKRILRGQPEGGSGERRAKQRPGQNRDGYETASVSSEHKVGERGELERQGLDGPALENGRFIQLERVTSIQQRSRHTEELQQNTHAEQQDTTPARWARKPKSDTATP